MDFDEEIKNAIESEDWLVETSLHTPTFECQIKPDGTMFLRGPALREGFTLEAAQALTSFLLENVEVPAKPEPYDFSDFRPIRVDLPEPPKHLPLGFQM